MTNYQQQQHPTLSQLSASSFSSSSLHFTMTTRIVELVSNASNDIYPDNTLAAFSNFLSESIELSGQWEVALAEISYPALYNNINDGKFTFVYKRVVSGNKLWDHETFNLPPGMYNSVDKIIQTIDEASRKVRPKNNMTMQASVMDSSGLVELTLEKHQAFVIQSEDLSSVLGIPINLPVPFGHPTTHIGKFPVDFTRIHSVMVYTDIVEHDIVGDTKAPLLRSFPFSHKTDSSHSSMSCTTFDRLQFRRLSRHSFHSIRIELRTPTGELIPFKAFGSTRVVLIFRKSD